MTVEQLIAELSKFDPYLEVTVAATVFNEEDETLLPIEAVQPEPGRRDAWLRVTLF